MLKDEKIKPMVVRRTQVNFDQNMVQIALLDYAVKAAKAEGKALKNIDYICTQSWNFVVTFEEGERNLT